jgi:hypothetical protein
LAGGAGLQILVELPWPISIGGYGQVYLTRKSYVQLDESSGSTDDEQVYAWRLSLGLVTEVWLTRILRPYLRVGMQIDSPFHFNDDDTLGISSGSQVLEVGLAIETVPRRAWIVPAVGLNWDVEHNRFETDYLGEPTTIVESRNEPFAALRLRVRMR